MAHTYKRTRSEDKPKNKYKRKDKKKKGLNQVSTKAGTCEQEWNMYRDVDASDF